MSCSLYWKPLIKKGTRIGDHQIRDMLNNKYGLPATLRADSHDYLEGARDAGIEGADELIKAIHVHGEIEIYKEC